MTLRPATSKDVAAMHALRLLVRENRLRDPSRVTEADYLPFLRQQRSCWIAELEGRLVGFAIADLEARSIWALFVSPDIEGRGIGRALLEQVTNCLVESGPGLMHLVTEPGTRAERLYTAAGWVKAGLQPSGEIRFERDASERTVSNRSTYMMATACVAVLAASFLLPRILPDSGGGFASATSAALLFMALAVVAAIASLALWVHTFRQRRFLSLPARIAGAVPTALVALGVLALWLSIRGDI